MFVLRGEFVANNSIDVNPAETEPTALPVASEQRTAEPEPEAPEPAVGTEEAKLAELEPETGSKPLTEGHCTKHKWRWITFVSVFPLLGLLHQNRNA